MTHSKWDASQTHIQSQCFVIAERAAHSWSLCSGFSHCLESTDKSSSAPAALSGASLVCSPGSWCQRCCYDKHRMNEANVHCEGNLRGHGSHPYLLLLWWRIHSPVVFRAVAFTDPLRNLPKVMQLGGEEVGFGGLSYLILMLVFFMFCILCASHCLLWGWWRGVN